MKLLQALNLQVGKLALGSGVIPPTPLELALKLNTWWLSLGPYPGGITLTLTLTYVQKTIMTERMALTKKLFDILAFFVESSSFHTVDR